MIEVLAISSFSHERQLWWGSKDGAAANKEGKALYNRVDRSLLPDKTVAPAFPGSAGCRAEWDAIKQTFVDDYNNGTMPDDFLGLGKWPDDVQGMKIWPGLARVARQLPKLMRAPRAPHRLTAAAPPTTRASAIPSPARCPARCPARPLLERGRF